MKAFGASLLMSVAVLAAGPVAAQQARVVQAPAARCLTPLMQAKPSFPAGARKRHSPGRVLAEFRFNGPDAAPDVTVLSNEGDPEFVQAVKSYAAQLRAPCHESAGPPARLRLDFVFKADDGAVDWFAPEDIDATKRAGLWECSRHSSGIGMPAYPEAALRSEIEGRVFAQLRFVSSDGPPLAKVFAPPANAMLADAVAQWVKGLRLPCFDGRPFEADVLYVFKFEDSVYGGFLRGLDLASLLPRVDGSPNVLLDLNTQQMSCPFSIRLQYRRPYLPNQVEEIGDRQAARRPLLEWLSAMTLRMDPARMAELFGDTAEIVVPCMNLKLPIQSG